MRKTEFHATRNRLRYGKSFLRKRELMRKRSYSARVRMVTDWECKPEGYSIMTRAKIGGAGQVRRRICRRVSREGRTRKCFMISAHLMTKSSGRSATRTASAGGFWKSEMPFSCNI